VTLAGAPGGIYYEWMNLTVDPSLATINVLPGATLGDKGSTTLGNPANAVIVNSNASLTFYNSGGNVTLNKRVVLCDGATVQNGGGANTALQPVVLGTNAAGSPGNCTFKIGGTSLTFSNAITGPGNLIKTGSSPLKLAAANTFTGSLMLSNGTVALLGGGSVSSCSTLALGAGTTLDVSGRSDKTLSLVAGQALQGYGTINGNLTVNAGATAAPGDPANLGTLIATNAVVLLGTTVMKLNKSSATNDVIGGAASLTYGGTLAVSNLAGMLTVGDRFRLFGAAKFMPSAFTAISPSTPGQGLVWDTSRLTNDGTLRLGLVPPSIASLFATPTNLTLRCSDGSAYGSYRVLASTNLTLPKAIWAQVGAGSFDGNGAFTLTLTNDPSEPQTFYLLQVP
jgi:autotransporter-associated beta strand protein